MALGAKGKSGGARVVYYYVDMRGEVWFLDVHLKKDKASLTDEEQARFHRFIQEVINAESE
jgi:hypothetical protein